MLCHVSWGTHAGICWKLGSPCFCWERIMFGRNLANLGFLKLESFNTTWVISYGISGFKVSTIWRIFYWLLLVLMGSNAMAAQQLLTQCPCVLLWLICWFDMFCSFKWLIWLYNDWTGLNYIVRLGLGVWWVPLSHPTSLCPKMKHTHTPISTSQSSHYLPQEQRPFLEYVSVLDTSKCKKSQVHQVFPFFSPNVSPLKKRRFATTRSWLSLRAPGELGAGEAWQRSNRATATWRWRRRLMEDGWVKVIFCLNMVELPHKKGHCWQE